MFIIESVIAALFPPTCVLCGAPGARGLDLCAGCDADLPRNRHACVHCASPFVVPMPPGTRCGRCQKVAPPFDRCIAAFRYEAAVPSLVSGAKFHGQLNRLRLLGYCLAETISAQQVRRPDALIPVPLHPRRLRERGYNQALEIARVLSRELVLPVNSHSCARIAYTPHQSGLAAGIRRRNLRGAFVAPASLHGEHLVIIDDVVTTGSTVTELSRVLLRAGARQVDVWTVARTPV